MVTDAGKGQIAFADGAALHLLGKLIGDGDVVHVDDSLAVGTDEMHVRSSVIIETLHAVYHADGGDNALLLKCGEIAVDRAEGKIRDCCLEPGLDPVGGGMFFRRADTL